MGWWGGVVKNKFYKRER